MKNDSLWEVGLVVGIVTTLFGIAAVFWPQITLVTLLYLFAAYVLVIGIANFFGGIFSIGHKGSTWFLRVIIGLLEVGVGVYLLRHPHVTFATFILLIGFTLIFKGVFAIVEAFINKASNTQRMLGVIAGLIATVVGIVVLFQPAASGVAFVWLLGLYALITGPLEIAAALDIRKEQELATAGSKR